MLGCITRSVKTSVLNGLEVGLYVFATKSNLSNVKVLFLVAKPYPEQTLD
jgi:hypothetical protein